MDIPKEVRDAVSEEPRYRRFTHSWEDQGRRVVTPLTRLLNQLDIQALLDFLQSLGVKFTLTTEATKYRFRLYWWEYDGDGHAAVVEYFSTGESPRKAMVSGIASFLVSYQKDFHDLVDSRMDFREDGARGGKAMRRNRRQGGGIVDAADLKSADCNGHAGASPAPATSPLPEGHNGQ